MASVFEKLQRASFKGFEFLVPSESKSGGKKIIDHNYPNSDVRFLENLGRIPPNITLTAIIHGENGIEDRIRFESILEEEGAGTLVHPIYGKFEAESTTYSVNGSDSSVGQFTFEINFKVTRNEVTPAPVEVTESEVSASAEAARESIDDALEEEYRPPTFADRVRAAVSKATEIYDTVNTRIQRVVGTVQTAISTVQRVVANVRRRIFTIVSTGTRLKDSLRSFYGTILDVANTPDQLLSAWEDLTDFGFLQGSSSNTRDQLIEIQAPTTANRFNIANNDLILDEHTRLEAFINYMEAAAYNEYSTDEELNDTIQRIEEIYIRLLGQPEIPVDTTRPVFDALPMLATRDAVRTAIEDVRVNCVAVLIQKSQNTTNIIQVPVSQLDSIALLSFNLYGNQDNEQTISALNPNVSHSNFRDMTINTVGD